MISATPAFEALKLKEKTAEDRYVNEVLKDYWICCVSREVSLLGRKEVLTGKAKFGILGDGKEVPQVAMARAFKKGDWRSGYYRDQTFMFALGLSTVEDYFAQLYADPVNDPFSGGRQMNAHFATPTIDEEGKWLDHADLYNISSDVSPTGGQMARGLGLAMASKVYRNNPELAGEDKFSREGKELCVVTIGDASTSEGIFWESVNAATVLRVPMAISVWDDGYGISVPIEMQTAKGSISEALKGFQYDEKTGEGLRIFTAKAWDYVSLVEMYERGLTQMRKDHVPVLFHIKEVTQPQGHSTSGSHERYKSEERLAFEQEMDCITKMEEWMIETGISTREKLDEIREQATKYARECKANAWKNYTQPVVADWKWLQEIGGKLSASDATGEVGKLTEELKRMVNPLFAELVQKARKIDFYTGFLQDESAEALRTWLRGAYDKADDRYHTHLYSNHATAADRVPVVPAKYANDAPVVNGFQVLNRFFDRALERDPRIIAFGEDLGKIGGVNQGFAGLQEKVRRSPGLRHGDSRVDDHRPGDRSGDAWAAAYRGDSVPGLFVVRPGAAVRRPGDACVTEATASRWPR
jgi:TPP-dependent pyruvate/acetoin dehydrogenase alpha subunit